MGPIGLQIKLSTSLPHTVEASQSTFNAERQVRKM